MPRFAALLIALVGLLSAGSLALAATPTPGSTLVDAPMTVTITGRATSGTPNIAIPPGIPITLQVARPDPKTGAPGEAAHRDSALTAEGTFAFENIMVAPGDVVIVSAIFQGIQQVSTPIQLAKAQNRLDVPLILYAVTDDPSIMSVVRVQHLLDFKSGLMSILATYDFRNNGDRLYVSRTRTVTGLPVSVQIPLPVGARAVAFNTQTGLRFYTGGDVNAPVVQDTKPVVPGQVHQVVFSYQLPYASGTPIDQDYPNGAGLLEVLIPDDAGVGLSDMRISTKPVPPEQIDRVANTTINPSRAYTQYTLKTPLKAGERLVYTLGKAQAPIAATRPSQDRQPGISTLTTGEILAILGIVIVLIVLGAFIVRQAMRSGRR